MITINPSPAVVHAVTQNSLEDSDPAGPESPLWVKGVALVVLIVMLFALGWACYEVWQ